MSRVKTLVSLSRWESTQGENLQTSGRFVPVLHGTEILLSPKHLHSWAMYFSFLERISSETDSGTGLPLSLGVQQVCSPMHAHVQYFTAGLSKAYLLSSSSELLSAMSRAWLYLFSICPFLIPHSSSLLLIVSVCLERLPLSTALMGSFHGGLRLEWIDRRQYPCCGKFANCAWAQHCCSSSYSSSRQDIGKGPSQLCASAGSAGQMWPDRPCAGLGEASRTQLLHAAFVKTFCISCTVPWR